MHRRLIEEVTLAASFPHCQCRKNEASPRIEEATNVFCSDHSVGGRKVDHEREDRARHIRLAVERHTRGGCCVAQKCPACVRPRGAFYFGLPIDLYEESLNLR